MTYKEMYFYLYAQMANALDCFYLGKFNQGISILEQAHIKTEEIAMETDIIKDEP
jgi:hypothetical protein